MFPAPANSKYHEPGPVYPVYTSEFPLTEQGTVGYKAEGRGGGDGDVFCHRLPGSGGGASLGWGGQAEAHSRPFAHFQAKRSGTGRRCSPSPRFPTRRRRITAGEAQRLHRALAAAAGTRRGLLRLAGWRNPRRGSFCLPQQRGIFLPPFPTDSETAAPCYSKSILPIVSIARQLLD